MKRTESNRIERKAARTDPEDGLTNRQRRAIPAIIEGPTMEAAARVAGVVKSTLYEWLKIPAFVDALEDGRGALYREGMDALKAAASKAARTLIGLLNSKDESLRRLTAVNILSLGVKAVELEDIEARIERLEDAMEAQAEAGKGARMVQG